MFKYQFVNTAAFDEQEAQNNERGVRNGKLDCLKKLLKFSESYPLPGYADFHGLSEEEVVERIRLEHCGY